LLDTLTPLSKPADYNVIQEELQIMLNRQVACTGMDPSYVLMESAFYSVAQSTQMADPEDNRYIYHSDHLGSSAFLTDASGTPTQHLQYLPFGEPFIEQRSVTEYYTPYTFSAKERDLETGYSYFGARYYSSNLSVWLSVDPMSDRGPWISPYAYAFHNPLVFVDPDGEWPFRRPQDLQSAGLVYRAIWNTRLWRQQRKHGPSASIDVKLRGGATATLYNPVRSGSRYCHTSPNRPDDNANFGKGQDYSTNQTSNDQMNNDPGSTTFQMTRGEFSNSYPYSSIRIDEHGNAQGYNVLQIIGDDVHFTSTVLMENNLTVLAKPRIDRDNNVWAIIPGRQSQELIHESVPGLQRGDMIFWNDNQLQIIRNYGTPNEIDITDQIL